MKHGIAARLEPNAQRRSLVAIALLAIVALIVVAIAPAGAQAAKANGTVDFDVVKRSKAGKGLVKANVKAGKPGATATDRKGSLLGFPVRNANANAGGKVKTNLKGSIVLKSKKRKVKINRLALVSKGKTAVRGKLGKRNLTLFKSKKGLRKKADGDNVVYSLTGAKFKLNNRAAKKLSRKLKVKGKKKLKGGLAGKAWVDFSMKGSTPPPPDDYPYAAECPVEPVEGEGFGVPPETVGEPQSPPAFTDGVEIDEATISWGFKETFRGYVQFAPPPGSVQAIDGATSSFSGTDYPAASGTYEGGTATDRSEDLLVANGQGTTLFCKSGHGFNIVVKNPTVVIDGESSRITADVGSNVNGTWYGFQRTDIATLDLDGAQIDAQADASGQEVTWSDVPATMTEDGAKGLGVYAAGEPLDPITVSVKTAGVPRPMLTECVLPTDGGDLPTIDFTRAALPDMTGAVEGEGGTINWGFRRASRSTVANPASGGSFTMFNGASEGYPGDMGGAAGAPPAGGDDKFFRFPVDEYAYDEGTPDPGDERLVATSEASVGFCNPNFGSWGILLSKPTLIIDGAESRMVMNAYGFRAGNWAGGRVDLVEIDASGVNPVEAAGQVTWGDVVADNTPLETGIPVTSALLTEALSLANLSPAATGSGWDDIAVQIDLPTP